MKRFLIAAASVLLIATSFAGCYDPLSNTNATDPSETVAETQAATEVKKADDYKNTLAGLRDFMKDSGYLTVEEKDANVTKMNAELIGAEKGYRYTTGNVKVELYAYKLSGKNPERDKVIESVKKNGRFTLYDKEITAYLSDSGKFLMIYSNSDISEGDTSSDAYKTMQKAIKAFTSF